MKFIYVFCKEASDELVSRGYKLLKADEKSPYYIFENKPELSFNLDNDYVFSNTMTF